MNIENIKIDKKKYLNIAIIFACIIAITLVGTYALKIWTSTENTELTFRIGDYSVGGLTCKSGEDVTISNIGPIFDYTKDGEVVSFTVLTSSTNTKPLNVSFNISTISDNLKEESFKYTLMSSIDNTTFTEVLSGNFKDSTNNSTIELITGNVITRKTYFKLIIYIDGNMENPISMQGGSLTGNIEMCIEAGDITIDSFKVNGTETTTFPLSSGYDINTTCSDASIAFDYRSQSYEISNITKSGAKCGFTYTTKSNPTYLNNYVIGLTGTTQGNGELVHEATGYSDSDIEEVLRKESYYGMLQYYSNSLSGLKTDFSSNITLKNSIDDSSYSGYSIVPTKSDRKFWFTNVSNTQLLGNYYGIAFDLNDGSKYQLCYEYKPGNSDNKLYIYINNILYSFDGNDYLSASETNNQYGCIDFVAREPIAIPEGYAVVKIVRKVTSSFGEGSTSGSSSNTSVADVAFYVNKMSDTATTSDYGYRYEGKNPNNYIYFNNELWRIIGVFDEDSHGKTGQYLTKIIRNDSLGGYAWDKSNSNNWATSSLYNLLNTNYYNATDGTSGGNCYQYSTTITGNCDYTETGLQNEYRNMVENVTWYLGGKNKASYTSEAFYTGERDSTSVYSGNTASTTGYIGLMYASDYGYSVLSTSCARTTNLGSYNTSACGGSSWLKKEIYEWTVTHRSASSSNLFNLYNSANLNDYYASYGYATRPVLYLKSNVQKIGGSGTMTAPYKIGY